MLYFDKIDFYYKLGDFHIFIFITRVMLNTILLITFD